MHSDDDLDAIDAIDTTERKPVLKPKAAKKRARRSAAPFVAFPVVALMVLVAAKHETILQRLGLREAEAVRQAPPVVASVLPDVPGTFHMKEEEQPEPEQVAPPAPPTPAKTNPPIVVPTPVVEETPEEILRNKGLVLVNGRFILADREKEAYTALKTYMGKFENAAQASTVNYEVEVRHNFIRFAEKMRDNIQFDRADLNIALDSLHVLCGPRIRSLNSDQRVMHYQELFARQNINEINRGISDLREDLKSLPPRNVANANFASSFAESSNHYASVSSLMESINKEYDDLRRDQSVREALANYNRSNNSGRRIEPTRDFIASARDITQHGMYYK